MQYRGHSPRTILYGRPKLSFIPSRAGVEDKPLRWVWKGVYVEPASSVIRRRGVGDAAPYGRFVYFALRHLT